MYAKLIINEKKFFWSHNDNKKAPQSGGFT